MHGLHALMHASNTDNLEILRGARAAGGGNWKSRGVSGILSHAHFFILKSIKAVLF
jgi:hypothetical protein